MIALTVRRCGFLLLAALAGCSSPATDIIGPPPLPPIPPGPPPVTPADTTAPALQREMRGLWVATVANIDWPSSSTLTAEQQRAELSDIMTRASTTGINTIVLQVRPAGDAVYLSALEPWAALLTGTQGKDPGYDPLTFAIQEAHARGMELHAWINPFRAGNTSDTARLAALHLYNTKRDLVRIYGGNLWMDPGEPEVHDHSMRVITDIVRRYDIDGIHADDYFYPYVVNNSAGQPLAFPDDASYSKYGAGLSRGDWRRANVDRFVERLNREVHAIKPTVKVGISPFGIWRPGFPAGVNGLDAFASIYADSRKWLQEGWLDYLAPQLYWAISAPQQSFPALLDWWFSQNIKGRHVWPGLATYRVGDGKSSAFTMQEIPEQIRTTRARPAGTGHFLYNTTTTLKRNGGTLAATLAADIYKTGALVPAVPWLDASAPGAPSLTASGSAITITPASGEQARWWVIRRRAAGSWTQRVQFATDPIVPLDVATDRVIVQAVDQAGNASAIAEWRR